MLRRRKQLEESTWGRARKWFGRPEYTDAEIEDRIRAERAEIFCAPRWVSHMWEQEELALRLLLAAKHADNVVVSLTDLEMIAPRG